MPLCALGRRWAARRAARTRRRREETNEKQVIRRCNKLNVFAAVVRILQCLSAWCVYALLALLFQRSVTPGAGTPDDSSGTIPPNYTRKLSSVAVLYHCSVLVFIGLLRKVKTSTTWRVFAVGTVLLDSVMMMFAIAMITVLSVVGLPTGCQALDDNSFKTHDMRQLVASYSNVFFGVGDNEDLLERLNLLCTLPKTVYVLAVISIFSHTLSIVLTVLQFQCSLAQRSIEARDHAGHVEEAVPEAMYNRTGSHLQLTPPPRGHPEHTLSEVYQQLANSLVGARIPAAPPTRLSNPNQHYPQTGLNWENPGHPGNPPAEVSSNPPGWRSSMETNSSFNPDLYLVSDGFRPLPSPPAYTSRPSSFFDVRI